MLVTIIFTLQTLTDYGTWDLTRQLFTVLSSDRVYIGMHSKRLRTFVHMYA